MREQAALAVAFLVTSLAGLVLIGWGFDVGRLKRLRPDWVAMSATTAVSFVLAGLSLGSYRISSHRVGRGLGYASAAAVVVINLVIFRRHFFGWHLLSGGAVAPATALNFIFIGCALTLFHSGRARKTVATLALLVALTSFIAIAGYVYGVKALYTIGPFTPMALQTAVLFLLLALGIVLAQTGYGLAGLLTGVGIEGVLTRRLLPAAILLPLLLGWLELQGLRAGLYPMEIGTALLALAMSITLVIVLVRNTLKVAKIEAARQQVHEGLQRSEASLAHAQSMASLGSWEVNLAPPDGCSVPDNGYRWSDEVYRIFGVDKQAFTPTRESFLERVHADDRPKVEAAMAQVRATGKTYQVEHRIVRADGKVRYVREHAECILDAAHKLKLLVGTVQDITEYWQLEQQFLQAQKLESLGRLAGGVAHDFNNLVTVINGYSELARLRLRESDPVREHVDEIHKAGERAADLTQQLLAFSRKQLMQPKPLNLNTVVTDAERLLRRLIREDITLQMRLDPYLGTVMADPVQIHQVIMNLVVNARDAMPDGGAIVIETGNVEVQDEYLEKHSGVAPGAYVTLCVSDTGVGMDEEAKAHIFDPFFTTKPRGSGIGLGLATVYGIVKQSGGWIWVYSEPGNGATFKIYLPRTHGESKLPEPLSPRVQPAAGKETILVIEDQPNVRRLAVTMLQAYSYTVIEAAGPEEALWICEHTHTPIDLILTDVVMPGLSGPEVVERVKQFRPQIGVVFMSGYTEDIVVHRGVLTANVVYLAKPFTAQDLTTKVRQGLAMRPIGAGGVS